ncbi:sortilin [Patella vulgata]|uniref:sortilin n=1 Tax=Patella vulgata TaxID=6465 RepID=UPI00217FDACE|nr:sortilin [Patella vulgata]
MERRKLFKSKFHFMFGLLVCSITSQVHSLDHVENFEITHNDFVADDASTLLGHESHLRFRREATSTDPKCTQQETIFLSELFDSTKNVNGTKLEQKFSFVNETNLKLALAWAGTNDDGVLIAVTTEDSFVNKASNLWRSGNFGRNWTKQNDLIQHAVIRQDDGVQRNPHNPKKIYLLTYHNYVLLTDDGGLTWKKKIITMDDEIPQALIFHSSSDKEDYVMAISGQHKLYVTTDNWKSPVTGNDGENIHTAVWGTKESKQDEFVFCLVNSNKKSESTSVQDFINRLLTDKYQTEYQLCKHNANSKSMSVILQKVASFGIQGEFLYASVFKEVFAEQNAQKIMKVSTDGGATWSEAQLPTLTVDRFYSVLDMSEKLIFMHVDNPGDTGHGTLYTSAGEGIIYSESLQRHLYPNFGRGVTDFYKVESLRGVYLASQIDSDDSIHSMITFDRGAIWQPIKAPENVECKDKLKGCFLQIHNKYSVTRGIRAKLPLSVADAKGLILVHGHVADALQTTEPDVFLTADGGYTWRKVLDGPHHYQVADSGGLIVAASLSTATPNKIKFSTDEGRCWHEYQFTDEEINLTGLLTEPGGKSLTVSIWGYHKKTRKWTINVIDFKDVIKKDCSSDDYVEWKAHESMRQKEYKGVDGCLLGKKETFRKLKPDSWCRNNYFYKPSTATQKCKCTREDYECDYGFERPAGSDACKKSPNIVNDLYICKHGDEEKLITNGYRLIPGDVCTGGFKPTEKLVDLKKDCEEGKKVLVELAEKHKAEPIIDTNKSGAHHAIVTIIIVIVLVVVVTLSSYFLYKMYLLRKHKVVYRYSLLNQSQTDNQDFDANLEGVLTNTDSLYNDTSDEEQDTTRSNGNPFEVTKPRRSQGGMNGSAPVQSYHDDSDDDLLN